MPRTLYIEKGSSPARAAWMGCKAVGVDVTIHRLELQVKNEHLSDWFVKLNPWHKVPTLDDYGYVLSESRSILRYLVDMYAPDSDLYPKEIKRRMQVERMLDYDLGTLHKLVGAIVYPEVFLFAPLQDRRGMLKELAFMDTKTPLAEGKFITGDHMTIADISIVSTISFLEAVPGVDFTQYPNVQAWRMKMKALSYFEECNAGFEKFKQEIQTEEWKRSNHAWMTSMGRPVRPLEEVMKKA